MLRQQQTATVEEKLARMTAEAAPWTAMTTTTQELLEIALHETRVEADETTPAAPHRAAWRQESV